MQLAELQKHFAHALLRRDEEAITPVIAPGRLPALESLSIYRVNVLENITDALQDSFSAVCALVGEACFRQMAQRFIQHSPPRSSCLLWYGGEFADFIAAYEPTASLPYLADMARVEWARQNAQYAADDTSLDAHWLAAQEEETLAHLPLTLGAGASLLVSAFPLSALYAFAKNPDTLPAPVLKGGGESLAVWRHEREIRMQPLNPAEFAALAAFAGGCTLEVALAAARQQQPELDPAELLGWVFALHILHQPQTMGSL